MQPFGVCHTPRTFSRTAPCCIRAVPKRRLCCPRAINEVAQGFLDLSQFVSSDGAGKRSAFDELAYNIGRDVYADLNGWHLLLKDMSAVPGGPKVHVVLADKIGAMMAADGYSSAAIESMLKTFPVKLGSGKLTVSLEQVMPKACVSDLLRLCEDFDRNS